MFGNIEIHLNKHKNVIMDENKATQLGRINLLFVFNIHWGIKDASDIVSGLMV